jgi:hypothetical protein
LVEGSTLRSGEAFCGPVPCGAFRGDPPRSSAGSKPRLEPFKTAIEAMLVTDLSAPKKQRHTGGILREYENAA